MMNLNVFNSLLLEITPVFRGLFLIGQLLQYWLHIHMDGKKKNGIENLSFSLFATTLCSTLSYLSLLQTCIVLDKYWEKVTPISPTCFSFFLNNNNKIQYIRPSYYNTYKKNSNQSQHVMYIIKFIYFVYDFIFLDLVSILLSLSNALDFILYFWGGFELITYNFPMCINEIEVIWWIIP